MRQFQHLVSVIQMKWCTQFDGRHHSALYSEIIAILQLELSFDQFSSNHLLQKSNKFALYHDNDAIPKNVSLIWIPQQIQLHHCKKISRKNNLAPKYRMLRSNGSSSERLIDFFQRDRVLINRSLSEIG